MHKRHAAGLALALLLAGCGRGPEFVEGPVVAPNPNPRAPLAAVLGFETDVPVTTEVAITDGVNAWTLEYGTGEDPAAGLALVGMRPGRTHRIEVAVRDGAGGEGRAGPFEFETPPLPEVARSFPRSRRASARRSPTTTPRSAC